MINRFLFFFLLIVLGCNSKQSSKEEEKDSLQLAPLTSKAFEKLFSPTFEWTNIETKISDEEKKKWFEENIHWVMPEYIDSSYLAGVHAMDFNGDGISDYIYSGRGPVTSYTVVSITGDSAGFSEQSFIINMDVEDKKVRRLYTNTLLASGGPPIDGYSIIDVVNEGSAISFVNRLHCDEIGRVLRPNKYTVFDVESVPDSSVVRSEPVALDSTYDYVLELPGNHLGKISKGSRATVVGQKNSLGINWYFALIWPKYKIKGYVYGAPSDSHPLVWIDERDCKRIVK
jgi:hypothetical protein